MLGGVLCDFSMLLTLPFRGCQECAGNPHLTSQYQWGCDCGTEGPLVVTEVCPVRRWLTLCHITRSLESFGVSHNG